VADDFSQQSASVTCSVSSNQHFDRSDDEGYYDAVASPTFPRSLSPECRSGKRLTVSFAASEHDGEKEKEGFKNSQMNKEGPEYDRFAEEDAVDYWGEAEDSEGGGSTPLSRWGEEVAIEESNRGPGFSIESELGEDEGQDESATGFHTGVASDKVEPYKNEPSNHDDYEDTGVITGSTNEGEYEVIGMDVSGSSGEADDSEEESCILDTEMPVGFSNH
jgi:hypothetical protein